MKKIELLGYKARWGVINPRMCSELHSVTKTETGCMAFGQM